MTLGQNRAKSGSLTLLVPTRVAVLWDLLAIRLHNIREIEANFRQTVYANAEQSSITSGLVLLLLLLCLHLMCQMNAFAVQCLVYINRVIGD